MGEHNEDGSDAADALQRKGPLSVNASNLGGVVAARGNSGRTPTSAHSLFVRVLRVASLASDEGCHLVLSA